MSIREFVAQKGIIVRYEMLNPGLRGCTFQKNGQWYIVVNRDDTFERQNFTIAHEYGEILLSDNNELTKDEKHRRANQLASELLLPADEFEEAVHRSDLHELKQLFPEVSFEVIARRIPVFIPSVISIIDDSRCTNRFGSDNVNYPAALSPAEKRAAEHSMTQRETVRFEEPGIHISAYYIDDDSVIERIYIITEIDEIAVQ
ncbi:ImmA/IrrE family metallo-endopeptidase [candidate division KSB1 bacterium]